MKDKCGIEIEPGCVVDVLVDGIMAAYVLEVRNGGLVGPDGRPEPAMLILNIAVPIKMSPGAPAPVYVIRPSDKPKTEEPEEKVH